MRTRNVLVRSLVAACAVSALAAFTPAQHPAQQSDKLVVYKSPT